MAHWEGQNKWTETIPEEAQTSDLLKTLNNCLNDVQRVKGNMDEELKEIRRMIYK